MKQYNYHFKNHHMISSYYNHLKLQLREMYDVHCTLTTEIKYDELIIKLICDLNLHYSIYLNKKEQLITTS